MKCKKTGTVTNRQLKKLNKKAEDVTEEQPKKGKKPLTRGLMYETRGGEPGGSTKGSWRKKPVQEPKKGKKK
jgi:hypothetical protein